MDTHLLLLPGSLHSFSVVFFLRKMSLPWSLSDNNENENILDPNTASPRLNSAACWFFYVSRAQGQNLET